MFRFSQEVYANRFIILALVRNDLKNRYQNSFFGLAWSFLSPLGLVLVIGFVFSKVMNVSFESFVPFLFSGILPWIFITQCADAGAQCFISGEGYIKQINLPLTVFPVRIVLVAFINLLIALVSFFLVLLIIEPERFTFGTLMTIPGLVILLFAGIGISTISGTINTLIRDFSHLQTIVLQALFYATPIIYPVNTLSGRHSWIYEYNPLYHIINLIREPLLNHALPNISSYIWGVTFAGVLFSFGIFILRKSKSSIVFKI